jgi:hypothetical protein
MRMRLLMMSLLERVLNALNAKQAEKSTVARDERRTALLGDEKTVHEQTLRTRAFADEIAARMESPVEKRRFW